jgi:hypothetical protein
MSNSNVYMFKHIEGANRYSTELAKPMFFKDGLRLEIGHPILISVRERMPSVAVLQYPHPEDGKIKTVHYKSLLLYKYFEEFIKPDMEAVEAAMYDGYCPSLLGEEVEPDGYDSEGFPSILLAAGLA